MNQPVDQRTVVTVQIGGEEYTLRALATPDYTRECAAYVDRKMGEILGQGPLVQAHKAGILAALALSDELFQVRAELEGLRAELARRAARLAEEIEARLEAEDLAAPS